MEVGDWRWDWAMERMKSSRLMLVQMQMQMQERRQWACRGTDFFLFSLFRKGPLFLSSFHDNRDRMMEWIQGG